jgi:choline dehydrogenase-like flavoprotein
MADLGGSEFDYVIVGAGTAGCVLANRLSADPAVRVCLIEAGGRDSHPFIHVPAGVAAAIGTKGLGWGYWSVPQAHLDGRKIPIPRGRVLGGSSSINGMAYHRGQPADYDDWAAMGSSGWSYAEVLPYFKRSENNPDYAGSPFHGQGGEMNVTHIPHPNRLNDVFAEAMASLQFRHTDDFAGANGEGYGLRQGMIRGGHRESGVTAFLRPVQGRPNLAVATDAAVQRVLIEDGRAIGVETKGPDGRNRILARREVILSAGAIGSPQILMLSGVGHGEELKAAGIEVTHHLPAVGKNFHDHFAVLIQMLTDDATSYGISLKALPRGAWNVLEYALARRGPFASNVFESTAFIRTVEGIDRPDIQLVFQPARRNLGKLMTFPLPVGHGFQITSVLLYPKSRGTVALTSPDPAAAPAIDPNLLADPADYEPVMRGLKLTRRIFASPAFAPYKASELFPGPDVQSDDQFRDYIKRTCSTVHHPAGSCRMGSDAGSVVDPQLKVRGVEGLRVVDASIMPRVVGGNTNAPVVMIAEKAADMILGKPALPAEHPAAAVAA